MVGLVLQGFAILMVLNKAGAFDGWKVAVRARVRRGHDNLRRLIAKLPWVHSQTREFRDVGTGELEITGLMEEDFILEPQPTPVSLEEVGDRLNDLRAELTSHDRRLKALRKDAKAGVDAAKEEAKNLASAIEKERKEEAREAIRDRRLEGLMIVAGGVLQVAGAGIVILAS